MKRKPLPVHIRMVEVLHAIEACEKIAKRTPKAKLIRILVRLYDLRDILKTQVAKIDYEQEQAAAAAV